MEISKAVEKLKKEINYHNWLYYVKNSPEISDGEYDGLYSELAELERNHPEFRTPDSPTQRVGGEPLREFRQVKHGTPMLSLENTYSADDIRQWVTRNQKLLGSRRASFVVEPKIDGVGISLRYEKGKLVLGATRGDGFLGDDITSNLRTIKSIPLALRGGFPDVLVVRGEVYMEKDSFQALNRERSREGQALFANPRNAAAGTLKLLDPAACARRKMNCFIYQAGEILPESKIKTHRALLDFFGELGLRINPLIKKFT
ncbi:MAG: NAD-dependent DNA ligase LigA, partial [bacterium]